MNLFQSLARANGFALLEAALGLIILLPLLFSAMAVTDYLQLRYRLSEAVRGASQSPVASGIIMDTGGSERVSGSTVQRSANILQSRLSTELGRHFPHDRYPDKAAVVVVAVLVIDPRTGRYVRLHSTYSAGFGMMDELSLEEAIDEYLEIQPDRVLGVPYVFRSGERVFQPYLLLVGSAGALELAGQYSGSLMRFLGQRTTVSSISIHPLRAEPPK